MQLNVKSLTKAKCAILEHLMEKHKATAITCKKLILWTSLSLRSLIITGLLVLAAVLTNSHICEELRQLDPDQFIKN